MDSVVKKICKLLLPVILVAGFHSYALASNFKELNLNSNGSDTVKIKSLLDSAVIYIKRPGEELADMNAAMALIDQAEELCGNDSELNHWLLISHYWKGLVFLEKREWDVARSIMIPLAEEFRKIQDTFWEAKTLDAYGSYLPGLSELLDEKIEILKKVAVLFHKLDNIPKEIVALRSIEEIHIIQGKLELAEQSLIALVKRCEQENYQRTYKVYMLLSGIEQKKGNLNSALKYGLLAFKSMEASAENTEDYSVFIGLAQLYYQIGDEKQGLDWHRKAFEIGKVVYPNYVYLHFEKLISTMIAMGEISQALDLSKEAKAKYSGGGRIQEQTFDLCLGICYNALKQYSLAEKYFESVLETDVTYIESVYPIYSNITQFYMDQKQYQKARQVAINMLNQRDDVLTATEKSKAHLMLSTIDSELGNFESSLKHLRINKQLSDSIFTATKTRQLQELNLQYETERKEKDIQLKSQSIDLLTNQTRLQEQKLSQARLVQIGGLAGIAFLAIILGMVYHQNRLKQKNNKTLKHLLIEKEILLKEVHHRVKNNLQTVLSLLESQSRNLTNEAYSAISETQSRVYTMSLIHKKLYQSDNVAAVNISDYLMELVQHLRDSFGNNIARIKCTVDNIVMDVSQAVPIGLIINEAVTNSLKHAFRAKHQDNEIQVVLSKVSESEILLKIEDNGSGLGYDAKENQEGLGLKLIRGLAEDLEGMLAINSENGMKVIVTFSRSMPLHTMNENSMDMPA